jgi:hypothetical protein
MIRRIAPAAFVLLLLGAAVARAQTVEPVTVRATRLAQPLVVDGRLDDAVYHDVDPAPAFLQQEPRVGEPATETFNDAVVQYNVGPQRKVSGRFTLTTGEFYSGHRQQFEYRGRVNANARLGFEPRFLASHITLPQGSFTTKLVGSRTTFGINPHLFVSALVQYNSSLNTLESNIRWRWEYQSGSDLFVVYTDGRDTFGPRSAALMNRGLAIKATRLLRF